jgi:HK97 family phage prohead protease
MSDLIRKSIDVIVKATDDEKRTITFIGSTNKVDRDGEVIDTSGWELEHYRKNPVFLWQHNYSNPPVGKTKKVWKQKGELKFEVEFPTADVYPFADTIYKLYKEQYLNAVSVAFFPKKWKDGDVEKGEPYRTFTKQELAELSGVTVPANADALAVARGAGCINDKEFVFTKAVLEGNSVEKELIESMTPDKEKLDDFLLDEKSNSDNKELKPVDEKEVESEFTIIYSSTEQEVIDTLNEMNKTLTAIATHLRLKGFMEDMTQDDDRSDSDDVSSDNDKDANGLTSLVT